MYGVRKLTHTTYANQRMTLSVKIAKISMSKRNTMAAHVCNYTWRVFIIHVYSRAFGDASQKTW